MSLKHALIDLEPLRAVPVFRRLWIGQMLSVFGGQVAFVAVMFQVWDETPEYGVERRGRVGPGAAVDPARTVRGCARRSGRAAAVLPDHFASGALLSVAAVAAVALTTPGLRKTEVVTTVGSPAQP